MSARQFTKNLAGMEDIAQGKGAISQQRGVPEQTVTVHAMDVPYAVDTIAEVQALDVSQFTRARLYYSTINYIDLVYNPLDPDGLASATGTGTWYSVADNPVVANADANFNQLNGGVWQQSIAFTAEDQYMIYLGVAYKPQEDTALPYVTTAVPDLDEVEAIPLVPAASKDIDAVLPTVADLKAFDFKLAQSARTESRTVLGDNLGKPYYWDEDSLATDDSGTTAFVVRPDSLLPAEPGRWQAILISENAIADDAITTAKILDDQVTSDKLAADSVDSDKLDISVAGEGITQDITGALEVNVDDTTIEVDSDQLRVKDLGIDEAKIAVGAVTVNKLGSNSVDASKIQSNAVDQAEIASGAVHASELDTSNSTESYTITAGQQQDRQVLSGGQYSFYPRISITSNFGALTSFNLGSSGGTIGLNTYISMAAITTLGDPAITGESTNRFVNSSAPWNMGHGDIALFIFFRVNNEGHITGSSVSPAPVWGYNGKTSLVPDRVSKTYSENGSEIFVKKFKTIVNPDHPVILPPWQGGDPALWNQDALDAYLNPEMVEIEIDQSMKNADMVDIPHPFNTLGETDTVVLIDPCSSVVDQLACLHKNGENIAEMFRNGYLTIGNECLHTAPNGVSVRVANWA